MFWLRRYGVSFSWEISIGIGVWTAWLNFTDFRSSVEYFLAYPILLSIINNLSNPFYRWFSWGKTIVDIMPRKILGQCFTSADRENKKPYPWAENIFWLFFLLWLISIWCWSYVKYRKIPKISPGAYIFQRPFLTGLFLEGLIYGGNFSFQNQLG